jgi:hypothetical protein
MVQQQRKIQANRLEGNHWNQNDIDERVAQLCNKIYLECCHDIWALKDLHSKKTVETLDHS